MLISQGKLMAILDGEGKKINYKLERIAEELAALKASKVAALSAKDAAKTNAKEISDLFAAVTEVNVIMSKVVTCSFSR